MKYELTKYLQRYSIEGLTSQDFTDLESNNSLKYEFKNIDYGIYVIKNKQDDTSFTLDCICKYYATPKGERTQMKDNRPASCINIKNLLLDGQFITNCFCCHAMAMKKFKEKSLIRSTVQKKKKRVLSFL